MQRIQAYIDETTSALLVDYAKKNDCSLSHAAGNIIASALMMEQQQSDMRAENRKQFLRLLNVMNQVLACVYDARKVNIESDTAQECLDKIKAIVQDLPDS